MTEPYPQTIYFVQRPNEYLTFIGRLIKIAAFGYTLGIDVMLVARNVPASAPAYFYRPGLWVEYSDRSVELVGGRG